MVDAWIQGLAEGTSQALVEHVRPELGTFGLHFFDLRPVLGVLVAVLIPTQEPVPRDDLGPGGDPLDVRPRFARVTKSQVSTFLEVDDAFCQILGWSADELVGRRSLELIHPDEHPLAIQAWVGLLSTPGLGRRVRLRHLRKDGAWAWLEVTNYNLLGDPEHGVVRCDLLDISEEMAAHETVRSREQLLRRLAEALPVGVLQLDARGRVLYSNTQTKHLTGRHPGSVDELLTAVANVDIPPLRRAFSTVLEGSDHAQLEVTLAARGDVQHLNVVIRRLDDDGRTTGAVACLTDVTQERRLRLELQRQATFDPLTLTLNRTGVLDVLDEVLHRAGPGVAAVFIDLDGFKAVNDEHGHAAGDEVLRATAQTLRGLSRDDDQVGRLGGDEFLLVCDRIGSAEEALACAQRLAEQLRKNPPSTSDGRRSVGASVGVAWAPSGTSARALVRRADTAMYAAKAAGDGRAVLAP